MKTLAASPAGLYRQASDRHDKGVNNVGRKVIDMNHSLSLSLVSRGVVCFLFFTTMALSAAAASSRYVGLSVYPETVSLTSATDIQRIVVQATRDDATTCDVTSFRRCRVEIEDPGIASIRNSTVRPRRDGETVIRVRFAGHALEVPVHVTGADTNLAVSFKLDVMPILMRAGCNTGSCHGSARGQDGFHLSLFGYDPDGDYHRLTREISGRRVNLALPEESLMLTKATGQVPHTGGQRFTRGSEYYEAILAWLKASVPKDRDSIPKAVSLDLYPRQAVLAGLGAGQQLIARVHYSDGTDRDVTTTTVFESNNDNSAIVTADGKVEARKRGEAFIMARYATFTVVSQIIVVPDDPFAYPKQEANNYIDELVNLKLRKLRVVPSGLCTDAEFLRRAFLDITGTLPTPARHRVFMASTDLDKRERLVDELLTRKEFAELWVMKWAELLKIRSGNDSISYKAALLYYNWLQEKIAANVPMNQVVLELLSSTGGTFRNPPTNYYELEKDTLKTAENVAQVFLGMRLQCAQCHNHPFDRWTMNDYYSFASFFSQVGRKDAEDPREKVIFNSGKTEVKHPVTKKDMKPRFPGENAPELKGRDRRRVMAEWLTSKDNTYFSANLANLIWAHFLGQGITEPVDDVRISNPPSNPELLEALSKHLVSYDYDFKQLVKDICTSLTYQRSTRTDPTNEGDHRNFSHASIRRIRAEILLDAISQVTQTKNKFKGLPLGARAVQIADGSVSSYFLTTFGRASRKTVCSCEVKTEPNLSQALHLLNGETTNKKIRQGKVVPTLLKRLEEPRAVLDQLYLSCLGRSPTPGEQEQLLAKVDASENTEAVIEDVFWAILNSKEFVFNH